MTSTWRRFTAYIIKMIWLKRWAFRCARFDAPLPVWLTIISSALQSHAFRIAIVTTCPIISGNGFKQNNSVIMSAPIRPFCPLQFGHFVRPIRPFCPLYSAILSPLFGQNGRLFYIRNLIRVHCTPDSRWCHHYARACTRVHTREKTALKGAGRGGKLA